MNRRPGPPFCLLLLTREEEHCQLHSQSLRAFSLRHVAVVVARHSDQFRPRITPAERIRSDTSYLATESFEKREWSRVIDGEPIANASFWPSKDRGIEPEIFVSGKPIPA